jgi:preprotein translocase subunit SecA
MFEGGILGITGTLKCLEAAELSLIKAEFKLSTTTLMPSIYGSSKRDFKEQSHVKLLHDQARFHQVLLDDILEAQRKSQPVLVFFETAQELAAFADGDYGMQLGSAAQKITPLDTAAEDVSICVQQATDQGKVTLWTREFGRGLDFVCNDDTVAREGGVRVIQAFLSDTASEETQIMGRTARMGAKGEFRMVLLASQVAKTTRWAADKVVTMAQQTDQLLSNLRARRSELRTAEVATLQTSLRQLERKHIISQAFRTALINGQRAEALRRLNEL